MVILKTKFALGEHLMFFIVFSKEKGNTNKISLSKDLIDMEAHNKHCISVFKPYFFVRACLPIELHWNLNVCCLYIFLFFFFCKIRASKLGVQLIHGFYGRNKLLE